VSFRRNIAIPNLMSVILLANVRREVSQSLHNCRQVKCVH